VRPDEVRALGELAGDAAAGVATQAREVHDGISGRVFRLLGPPAQAVRFVHDRVADRGYAAACALSGTLVRESARAVSLTRADDARSLADTPAGCAPSSATRRFTSATTAVCTSPTMAAGWPNCWTS
jgi:hypothetical protein